MARLYQNYEAQEKLQLYQVATDLFRKGFSHPQVVDALIKNNYDQGISNFIADSAYDERWDKLFDLARSSYAYGKTYPEVVSILKQNEDDEDIAEHIAALLYEIKTVEMENSVESPTNIFEGKKWLIITGLVIPFVFILKFSLITRIVWIIAFIFSLIQYLWGIKQNKIAKQVKKFMEHEQD